MTFKAIVLLFVLMVQLSVVQAQSDPLSEAEINTFVRSEEHVEAGAFKFSQEDINALKARYEGSEFPDLKLMDLAGSYVGLADLSNNGERKVLFVTGSYSCPLFRHKLDDLIQMHSNYQQLFDVYLVYTLEAHPYCDPSPYSDSIWLSKVNREDSIYLDQPKNMAERLERAKLLQRDYEMQVPILLDDPNNSFWEAFGQMVNIGVFVGKDGVIRSFNPKFSPHVMSEQIDAIMNRQEERQNEQRR